MNRRKRTAWARTLSGLLTGLATAATVATFTSSAGAPAGATDADSPSCGPTLYKSSGEAWECTFDDEFSGTALDTTKWTPMVTARGGYHNGPECYVDDPDNISESDGTLNLTAREVSERFYCRKNAISGWNTTYTAGSVTTGSHFSQTYGRFEVRAKLPGAVVQGLQTSFWLWPVNATKYGPLWPQSGEIDIAEIYTKYPTLAIPYIHYVSVLPDPNVTNNDFAIDPNEFHDYVAEWTPSSITIQIDGSTVLVDNWHPVGAIKPAPFNQPFMVQLTQALGIRGNAFDARTTPLPATTQIDYVRVWK
jgi:beta-glucanase (GH16 family)